MHKVRGISSDHILSANEIDTLTILLRSKGVGRGRISNIKYYLK